MTHRTVRDVMTSQVVTVELETPAKEIARLLDDRRINAVPVLDEQHTVVGMVSEADLTEKIAARDLAGYEPADHWTRLFRRHRLDAEKARAATARGLMTAPVRSVRPDESVVVAAVRMERRGVKSLPVVDGVGELVGIVSRADLVRIFVRPDAEIRGEVESEVLAKVLAGSPVTVNVLNGVVTLRGEVDLCSQLIQGVELCRRIDGVVSVDNELAFQVDDTVYSAM